MPGNRLELNARLAASLDAPVLMVLDANSATGVDDLVNKALVSRNGLTEERAEVMGLIVNKVTSSGDTAGPGLLPTELSCIRLEFRWLCKYCYTSAEMKLAKEQRCAPGSAMCYKRMARNCA